MKGSFGPLEKSIWRARAPSPQSAQLRPQAHRAQSPQSGKREVLERLKRPESRGWLLRRASAPSPQPAQLRPQSRRAQSPQSGKCEVLERLILAEPRDHSLASARFWSV